MGLGSLVMRMRLCCRFLFFFFFFLGLCFFFSGLGALAGCDADGLFEIV